jgi:hypothetical protein
MNIFTEVNLVAHYIAIIVATLSVTLVKLTPILVSTSALVLITVEWMETFRLRSFVESVQMLATAFTVVSTW